MARTKTYQHFCPVARSLEVIGEKWSLLIVRDLLPGPQRFTDLMKGLSNITPKWLTLRLRELEIEGILERSQEEGRREVWYALTPKGRELGTVVGALNVWGLRHAMRPPAPGASLDPGGIGRLMRSFEGFLIRTRIRPAKPVSWRFDFGLDRTATFVWDGRFWQLHEGPGPADVQLRVDPADWAMLLAEDAAEKRKRLATADITGDHPAVTAFVEAVCSMSA